tara:strand:+ start:387 stop:845 length:459 start_codon:yes stop_codon:yes gene_type:complete
MKILKLFILMFIVIIFSGVQNGHSFVKQEEIRTKNDSFKREIKIETEEYYDAKVSNVYLQHKNKKKRSGEKDYLYVKGTFKNLRRTILAGAVITAKFYDGEGNLIAVEKKSVIPRILRRYRKGIGHFTIKTKYDSRIELCKLEANWSGKEED